MRKVVLAIALLAVAALPGCVGGCSDGGSSVSPPQAPAGLTVSRVWNSDGTQSLSLAWQAPVGGSAPTGYEVQQRLESSSAAVAAPNGVVTATAYTRTISAEQELDEDMWLRVRSVNTAGASEWATVRAVSPPPPPAQF